jgi:uncharacterized damage-inducible protein DinB
MLTDQERQVAIEHLTKTRQTVIDAVAGLTEEQARWKPTPERWSILGYLEHLAVSDDALIGLVHRCLKTPAQPETPEERAAREAKLAETHAPRGANQAPDGLQPKERFATVQEALTAFLAARERTLAYARTTQDDLRSHFTPHPVYGKLDAYQWLNGNARHAHSHCEHMREIREMPGFPAA